MIRIASSPNIQKHFKPFAVPQRMYCQDAPLGTRFRFAILGTRGLSAKEQNEAPKILHHFILKQNAKSDARSGLKAMEHIAAFAGNSLKVPANSVNLQRLEFYRSYSQEAIELRASFGSLGKQMLEQGSPQAALPLLMQSDALLGMTEGYSHKTLAIRNCLEIARLCQKREGRIRLSRS